MGGRLVPRALPMRAGSRRSFRGPANLAPRPLAPRRAGRRASRPRRADRRDRAPFRRLKLAQLRLDRRGGCGLRTQLPVEGDGADENTQADIIEGLAELGRHGRRQLVGAWQHAADRRPEIVARVHGPPSRGASQVWRHCAVAARLRLGSAEHGCSLRARHCAVAAVATPQFAPSRRRETSAQQPGEHRGRDRHAGGHVKP